MLPSDSFFKQIPHALEPRARLILEAAGWAIDSILISFADLSTVALATPKEQSSSEHEHRLFVHCWSIVDQCHMLRSILQRLPVVHPEIAQFVQQTESFTLIRNSMDHLSEKLDNLVNTKEGRPPIFGVVSWARVKPNDVRDGAIVSYDIWSVSSGAVLTKPEWALVPRPNLSPAIGVADFRFEAFDRSLAISSLIEDIRLLIAHFDGTVRARIDNNIREAAGIRGLDPEELLKFRGSGGLKMVFRMKRDHCGGEVAAVMTETTPGLDINATDKA